MAYGKLKADTLVYDASGTDTEVTISSIGSKAPLASPTFTGTPAAPTAAANTNTTQIATTAFVMTELGDYATLAAPALTGNATAVNLTLSGNLTVNGTTTTVATTNTTISDNLIELNSGASSNANDAGILIERGSTGDNAIIAWDESEDKFIVGTTAATNDATGNLSITKGTIQANVVGDVTGDVTGDCSGYSGNCHGNSATASGLISTPNITVGTVTASTVSDSKGNVRSIPNNHTTSAYTLVVADAGKCVTNTTGGVTVNTSIFSAGDAVTIINHSGSDITITQGSSMTIYNTADAATGNRTLAGRGMATLYFTANNIAYISGAGLS